jgi:hypothetical protein
MALSGGALVSGLILWVDIYELFRGTVDAQFCELQQRDADARIVGTGTGCTIRLSYVALVLLYGPVAVPFWLLAVGAPLLAVRNFGGRANNATAPTEGVRILETMIVYVFAVIVLSVAGGVSSGWYFGAFREPVWPFLLAPPPLFAAVLCLGRHRRESIRAEHPG